MATQRELDYNKEFCATSTHFPLITISYQAHLKIIKKLKAQISVENIAHKMFVDLEDFKQSLEFYRIDPKLWALAGINDLKSQALKTIPHISDPEKSFNASMKFLQQYDEDGIMTDNSVSLKII